MDSKIDELALEYESQVQQVEQIQADMDKELKNYNEILAYLQT